MAGFGGQLYARLWYYDDQSQHQVLANIARSGYMLGHWCLFLVSTSYVNSFVLLT